MPVIQFSGLASGIDSKALIDAVIEARQKKNELKQDEIDFLNSENDSLGELNTKLLALSDLVDKFRTSNGGGVARKASSSSPTVATAAASASAGNGSYDLTVTSIADTATGSFTHSYSALSNVVSAGSGTVTVTVGTGSNQVALTASVTGGVTTVQQLVDALNADSDASGRAVVAAVNVGTSAVPDYRITVSTQVEGTDKGTLDLAASAAITELDAGTPTNVNISQASDAVFAIGGVGGTGTTITRQSNTVDDVITGLTFQLVSGGGASTKITVGTDPDSTADQMQQIVDAFNDIVAYVNDNNSVTRVEENNSVSNVFGSLAKTRIDDDFVSQFKSVMAAASGSSGTSVTSMSELGISTNRDGTLSFDAEAFKTKVSQDPTGATEVLNSFADSAGGTSGVLYQYTKFQGFIDIGIDANNSEIDNLNTAIDQLNRYTDKLRANMEEQFSRLESTIGELQNKQQALSGILASL